MTDDTFDPFDLPSSFDPLGSDGPPPPRQRRKFAAARPEPPANPRLAHLLPPAGPPVPAGPHRPATVEASSDMPTRLGAVEDEVAILTARLDDFQTSVTTRLEQQRDQLLEAVATLLDQRSRPRR